MSKILVLLDVDETLIDKEYALTAAVEYVKRVVTWAQNRGVVIGLNSDSALQTLRSKMGAFGLAGPVIAEKGALLIPRLESGTIVYLDEKLRRYQLLRKAFVREVIEANDATGKYLLIAGDVNAVVNNLPQLSQASCLAEFAIIINGLRSCSLGCWSRRRNKDGVWRIDTEALDDMIGLIDRVGPDFPDVWESRDIDRNEKYGIYIAHDVGTNKARAVDYLLRTEVFDQVFMVGDSMSDWLDDKRVVQCAVGNASDAYKEKCRYIASSTRTEGVVELLRRIA